MGQTAQVTSIDALREFKLALTEFTEIAGVALAEAHADVQRTVWWIENDQLAYWKNALRKRTAQLAQAKSELFRAQLQESDGRASDTLERRAAERAKQRLDEAERKIQNIKRWRPQLERELVLFKGHCQQLSNALAADLPKAVSRLEKMTKALEKYVKLAPKSDG